MGTAVTFLAYSRSQGGALSMSRRSRRQAKMSSRFHGITRAVAIAAVLALGSPAFAQQSDDADPEMRIQQLENQTAPAHRPERGTAIPQPAARGAPEGAWRRAGGPRSAAPVAQPERRRGTAAGIRPIGQPPAQPGYDTQIAAPAPIIQEPPQGRAAGTGPPPRRCLRSRPESECAGRAARAGRRPVADRERHGGRRSRRTRPGRTARSRHTQSARSRRRLAAAAACSRRRRGPDHAAAVGHAEGRVRPRHRLHAAQGLCAGRGNHAQLRAEVSQRSHDGGFAILARREFLPAPDVSRRRRVVSRGDHQIR